MYKAEHQARCPILPMSVSGASPISDLASWIITGLCDSTKPLLQHWLPLWAQWPVTLWLPPLQTEHQRSVNDFWFCILDYSWVVQWHTPIIIILAAFLDMNASDNIAMTY
jgi:hypothetical protein